MRKKYVVKAMKQCRAPGLKIHNIKTVMDMLKRLQGEIKLSDDDIMIIVYTSLDHDYFTNGLIL